MADKELRRLSRADLIEIIYELRRSEAALLEENESLKRELDDKRLKVSRAGSLAELAANLNGLFETAQATADQYLDGIKAARKQAKALQADAAKLAQMTLDERKRILAQTEEECRRMREAAAAGQAFHETPRAGQPRRIRGNPGTEGTEDA